MLATAAAESDESQATAMEYAFIEFQVFFERGNDGSEIGPPVPDKSIRVRLSVEDESQVLRIIRC